MSDCWRTGPAAAAFLVGGLYVDCRGEATTAPTVILESGAFGTSADWDLVLDDLSRGGRVCAYDRAGVGDSPPRAGEEDITSIAEELASLLDALGETRPVILVGHSNGALYAETFAALWPDRVAGLVYVNGVTSNDLSDPLLLADLTRERRLSNLAATAGGLGLASLGAGSVVKEEALPTDAARRKRRSLSHPRELRVARDEDRAIVPALYITVNLGGSPAQIPHGDDLRQPRSRRAAGRRLADGRGGSGQARDARLGAGGDRRQPPLAAGSRPGLGFRRGGLAAIDGAVTRLRHWALTSTVRPGPGRRLLQELLWRCRRGSGRRPCDRRAAVD